MAQRVPAGGRRAAPKKSTPNPRIAPGDNKPPKEDMEEAERVQLISFVSRITAADGEVEKAKGPFDAARKARTQLFNLAKAAGFSRKLIERRMDEMNTPTRELAEEVAREQKHRRWLGIIRPEDEQQSLLGAGPQEPRDEFHWRGEGYKAGLRQLERKAPPGCPERHLQAWLQDYDKGLEVVLKANAPKAPPETDAQRAEREFKEDNPEVDINKAARRLKNDPKFMDRSAPAKEPAPEIIDPDDGFEATEEELARQIGRPAPADADEVVV